MKGSQTLATFLIQPATCANGEFPRFRGANYALSLNEQTEYRML